MKKFVSTFVLLLVLSFSMSTFLVPHAEAAEDSWATLAPIPTERYFFGVAVVNGNIYAIGGINYGSDYGANATEMYDPVTNTWHTKASLPTPRYDFGIAVVDNKIYVIGGNILGSPSGWNITGVTEVYDPETDTWGALTPMPTPRMSLDANVVNGKIYMIGGFNYTWPYYSLDENEVYDPLTDSWTTKAPIPNATQAYASAVVNNKIYVIGGWKSSFNQIYDPETDTWSYGAPIPTLAWEYPVDSAAAGATTGVAAPKRIYVIGGKQNLDAVNLTQVYDPETDSWSTGAPLPTPRFGLGVAVVDDILYAIGGVTGWMAPVTATNEQYTPFGFWGSPPPDTTPPTISIVSPENKTYTVNNVSLTFTLSEPTSWIGYSLDGQANVTITGNSTLSELSLGEHSLIVYVKDTAGNTGASETIYFTIAHQSELFPTWIVAIIIVAIAVVGAALLVYFAKVKKTTGKTEKLHEGVI